MPYDLSAVLFELTRVVPKGKHIEYLELLDGRVIDRTGQPEARHGHTILTLAAGKAEQSLTTLVELVECFEIKPSTSVLKNNPYDASHQTDQIQYSQRYHPFEGPADLLAMTLSDQLQLLPNTQLNML